MNFTKTLTGIIAASVIAMFSLTGCQSGSYSNGNVKLNSKIDSISYAFGYIVGSNLSHASMDDINPRIFAQAMGAAFAGDSSIITPLQAQAMVRRYRMESRQQMMKKRQKIAKENKKKGQAFLKENKTKPGVKTTESGLEYKILQEGSGASPTKKDTVLVNYVGKHLNGEIFDQNDSISIVLTNVIPGWQEGIQLMKEGATFEFWIPGNLAYGTHPRGQEIKPNETLHFKVHLIKVK